MGKALIISSPQNNKEIIVGANNLEIWLDGTDFINKGLSTTTVSVATPTITNSTIQGESKKVYYFNGSSQYIQLVSVPLPYGCCSFSLWSNRLAFATWQRMFDWGSTNGGGWGILLANSSTNPYILWSIRNSGGTATEWVQYNSCVTGTWYHIVGTIDGNQFTAYLNGQLSQVMTLTSDMITTTLPNMYIGRSNWSADAYYNGYITDFRMYNKVLTGTEVYDIYSKGVIQGV